jgi:hypothetical protein
LFWFDRTLKIDYAANEKTLAAGAQGKDTIKRKEVQSQKHPQTLSLRVLLAWL